MPRELLDRAQGEPSPPLIGRFLEIGHKAEQADYRTAGHALGAIYGPKARYRYLLWRVWDDTRPKVIFVLLHPGRADEIRGDASIERCHDVALSAGTKCGGFAILNLFAWRCEYPSELLDAEDPVGPENDRITGEVFQRAGSRDLIVAAWGNEKPGVLGLKHRERILLIEKQLRARGGDGPRVLALQTLANDYPQEPLKVSAPFRLCHYDLAAWAAANDPAN
ncbi:MAG: DUF1643 domain-containing protein [Sumerlaeia bacterium]